MRTSLFTAIVAACALTACAPGTFRAEIDDAGPAVSVQPGDAGGDPDAGPQDAGIQDAGTYDAGTYDAGTYDAGTYDAGTYDAGTYDAGPYDAGTHDAGTYDAGTYDAGAYDAGAHDAGTYDAGTYDAGAYDAGAHDAGSNDAGTYDAGASDAGAYDGGGSDAGHPDAGGSDGGTIITLDVYRDSLVAGWFTDNWACGTGNAPAVDYTQTAVARSGSAVKVSQCGQYGAWTLDRRDASWTTNPFHPADYTHVSFDLNPGADAAALGALQLTINNTSPAVNLAAYATFTANAWSHLRVPLAALNGAGQDFYTLAFFNDQDRGTNGYVYYVDNLVLENDGSVAVVPDAGVADGGSLDLTVLASGGTPISPYVYGFNDVVDTKGDSVASRAPYAKLVRSGGNRWTGYNWENNASSSGTDTCPGACNDNDGYLGGGAIPGEAARLRVAAAHALDAGALITIPIIDYVAADEVGAVGATPADGGNVHFVRSVPDAGPAGITPDLNDHVVYQEQFVRFIESTFAGDRAAGRPVFYSLDNEPALWPFTHPLLHHSPPTYAEMAARTTAYGSMIKSVAPQALVFGGVCYGFEEYLNLQQASDGNGRDYLSFLLAQMQAYETAHGTRILDVLDLHWYPEALAPNGKISDINDINPSAAEIDARVQALRSLWDPTYQENSWIVQNLGEGIKLLPRIQAKIDASYPGTKLSFSEYNYGGSKNISGAIAQADVLGIFGQQGVFASNLWAYGFEDDANSFVLGAFDSYLNYDGAGAAVGDVSLPIANPDPARMSIHGMRSSHDASVVHLVVINKTQTVLNANLSISIGKLLTSVQAYQLTSTNPRPQPAGAVTIENNHLVYPMPPLSVSTLVLR